MLRKLQVYRTLQRQKKFPAVSIWLFHVNRIETQNDVCLPFCWSWSGGWKKGPNRIREHWFWWLRYLLHTSKCTFTSWLLGSLGLPSRRKDTHQLMSRVEYGFNQCSVVSFVIRKLCVLIYGETVHIYLYSCNSCKYIFTIYDLKINLQILSYFWIFCWPYTQRELYRKAKFWEDSKSQDKTQFENKRHKSDY